MWSSDEFRGYDVESELASREDVQVYRAVDQSDGSRVTLMVFSEAPVGDPCDEAFERESRIRERLAGVDRIEPVLEQGRTERGVPYLVLPDRPTGSLGSLMATRRVSAEEAVEMTVSLGSVVAAVNARGVALTAIDPDNISLDAPSTLRDLSQARVIGVQDDPLPASEAPEIRRGQHPTELTDVWVTGAFLYQLLEPGVTVDTGVGLASDPRVSGGLSDAVTRALSIEPIDRQPDVTAFLAALTAAASERTIPSGRGAAAAVPGEVDDDPTVQASEDVIRQIREASAAAGEKTPDVDDDPTVMADEDLIRQIRVAGAAVTQQVAQPDEDPTSVVDEDVVRQIRAAVGVATGMPTNEGDSDDTVEADESLIREIRASGVSPSAAPSDLGDETVVAGEDLVRQIRVAGSAAVAAPVDVAPPNEASATPRTEPPPKPIGSPNPVPTPPPTPDVPAPTIDDLRRRFSPQVQQPKNELVPKWVLITGVGAVGLLIVAILAVVIVG